MYKHDENTIDPRDKGVISFYKEKKKFVCEASTLHANGIEPITHHFTIGGYKWIIYLWSEKYQMHICYKHQRQIKHEGELIADVFVPYFGVLSGGNESKAHTASLGTELHILND